MYLYHDINQTRYQNHSNTMIIKHERNSHRFPSFCRDHSWEAGCASCVYDVASWDGPGHSSNFQCRLWTGNIEFYNGYTLNAHTFILYYGFDANCNQTNSGWVLILELRMNNSYTSHMLWSQASSRQIHSSNTVKEFLIFIILGTVCCRFTVTLNHALNYLNQQ